MARSLVIQKNVLSKFHVGIYNGKNFLAIDIGWIAVIWYRFEVLKLIDKAHAMMVAAEGAYNIMLATTKVEVLSADLKGKMFWHMDELRKAINQEI